MQLQQQFSGYPYWQQPVYPQQQSQPVYPQSLPSTGNGGGYTPYPGHYIPLGPPPGGFDPSAYQQQEPVTPRPQHQQQKSKHRRAKTFTALPSTPAQPLKPALKKNNTLSAAFPMTEYPPTRTRTNSFSLPPENTLHRIRTQSNARQTGRIIGDENYARKGVVCQNCYT